MKRALALVAVALLCGPAVWVVAGATRPWEEYALLAERNIFSRTRGQPVVQPGQEPAEPPPPERFTYLRGVMRWGGALVAFLEDTRSGQVTVVRDGDDAVRGKVTGVALDGIRYTRDGMDTAVAIGENFEKGEATEPSQPTVAPGTAPPPASGGAADVLERLRQRRQQELGR